MKNKGISKAVELITFDNLTPEERTKAKNQEESKIVKAQFQNERSLEIAELMISDNEPDAKIAKYTGLTVAQIQILRMSAQS